MLSWILLIAALILFSMLGMWLFSALFGRGEALPPMMDSPDVIAANRAAVDEGRVGDIQLEVVHRGYRMDQVDALIAQLTGADPDAAVASGPREFANPLSAADDAAPETGVESAGELLTPEGEPTNGSNETSHR